jgi:hypothetical protein
VAWKLSWRVIAISQVPLLTMASPGPAPEPTAANCVSWPAATTGMPAGRPVLAAASSVSRPMTSPGSTQAGNSDASKSASASMSSAQSRCAASMAIMVPAAVGSIERSPQSRKLSRPGIIIQQSASSSASGACSRSQMNLRIVSNGITWYPVMRNRSQGSM